MLSGILPNSTSGQRLPSYDRCREMKLDDLDTHDVQSEDVTAIIGSIYPNTNNQVLFTTEKGNIVTCDFDLDACFWAKSKTVTRASDATAYTETAKPPPVSARLTEPFFVVGGALVCYSLIMILYALCQRRKETKK